MRETNYNTVGKRVLGLTGLLALTVFSAFNANAITSVPVKFEWDASPDSSVTGYVLYYGAVNSTTNRLDMGTTRVATLKNLSASTNYFFYVKSYDSAKLESSPSDVIVYSPPAITNVKLTALDDGTMQVLVGAPAGAQCRVEYTESFPAQWQTLGTVTAAQDGTVVVNDPPAGRSDVRFYRAVLL